MRTIVGILALAAWAASCALGSPASPSSSSTPSMRGTTPLAATLPPSTAWGSANRSASLGDGEKPIFLNYNTRCDTVYNKVGCAFTLDASSDQERRIQCSTDGAVVGLVALSGVTPLAPAATGVLPSVQVKGVTRADVRITAAGFKATADGPEYSGVTTCSIAVAAKADTADSSGGRPAEADGNAAAADATPDLGTEYRPVQVSLATGGTRVELINPHAKDQTGPVYFSTPLLPLPVDTTVVIANMPVNTAQCKPFGGQPYATISTVYADNQPLECTATGDNECGSVLCTIPAGACSLRVEMAATTLGSYDPLLAGLSVSVAE